MFKYDLPAAVPTLHNLKKTIDHFLSDSITLNSIDKIGAQSEFAIEVAAILNGFTNNAQVYNLDFQYKKLVQIIGDIHNLNLAVNNEIPEWLENELEMVLHKNRNILLVLEIELN